MTKCIPLQLIKLQIGNESNGIIKEKVCNHPKRNIFTSKLSNEHSQVLPAKASFSCADSVKIVDKSCLGEKAGKKI